MDPTVVVEAANELAKMLNKVIDEMKIGRDNEVFRFKEKYEEEKKRPDRDHDDLVKWNLTRQLLVETIIEKIRPSST